MNKETDIICPYCEKLIEDEDYIYPITYCGEDGSVDFDCSHCEETFLVEENVERYYIVKKK